MHSNKFDIEQQLKGYRVPETRSKEEAWNLLSKKIAEHKAPKHTKIRMIGWSSVAAAAVVLLYFTLFREAEQPGFAKNDLAPRNAEEAIRLAHLARAASGSSWLKLEVTPDPRTLLPDPGLPPV